MLVDTNAIRCNNILSAEIAALTEKWEAENGPVETLPIRTDDKKLPYRISCPEKREAGRKKINDKRTAERTRNGERIQAMLKLGVPVSIICERTGLSQRTVRRYIAEN